MEIKAKVQGTKALESFKTGETKILVATDIASRGIDVDNITHVFNYDLPNEPESYVHRIGRTARAGKSGVAYGFCDDTESGYLVGIQQLIGFDIDVDESHDYHFKGAIPKPDQKPGKIKTSSTGSKNRNSNSNKNKNRNSNNNKNKNRNQSKNKSRNSGNKGKNRNNQRHHKPKQGNQKSGNGNKNRQRTPKSPYNRNRTFNKKN